MKKYIFLSKYSQEGYDVIDDTVLGIFEGNTFEEAFEKVLEKYDYLGYSGDRELYTAFELTDGTPSYKEFPIEG